MDHDGKSIDIVYLDFKNAFDSIPHERLLQKLKGCGIIAKVLNCSGFSFI